jgi:hypothetical protein
MFTRDEEQILLSQVEQQLRHLAMYLATPGGVPPTNITAVISAIVHHEDVFKNLAADFGHLTGGTEVLHWYTPHLLQCDLLPSTKALAVSPKGYGPEQATRFYMFDAAGGTILATKPERDNNRIIQRQTLMASWDLAAALAGQTKDWNAAIFHALRRHLLQAPAHEDPVVNRLVRDTMDSPLPTLDAYLTAYLALGLDPVRVLTFVLGDAKLPATHVIDPVSDTSPN